MLKEENYINFESKNVDKYIYRIISTDRLYELFSKKLNVLVRPKKWDDPFENFILNSKAELPNGEIANIGFRDNFYGQCWTKHEASDAMWRIYSPKSNGVRIRTTITKLANSLALTLGKWDKIQCFIGKVKYLKNKTLMDFANNIFKDEINPNGTLVAKTLLVKRPAFKHENEVRLLYYEKDEKNNSDIYSYDIMPHNFIDQIMVDPRINYSDFLNLKNKIKHNTKFKGRILRSKLYVLPKDMVFPFG